MAIRVEARYPLEAEDCEHYVIDSVNALKSIVLNAQYNHLEIRLVFFIVNWSATDKLPDSEEVNLQGAINHLTAGPHQYVKPLISHTS